MKKEDAQGSIMHEWDEWAASKLTPGSERIGTDALVFFGHLQQHRPGLLNFRNRGDKWQAVHSWLLRAGKVKN